MAWPPTTHQDVQDAVDTLRTTGMVVVNHGSTAGTARPSGAAAVYWVGTVTPTNMTSADLYNGPA